MDRSLHCHLPAKGFTGPTQLLRVFWCRETTSRHRIGPLRLSPSLGLGWGAAQMFQSQHDSLLPPRGLCGTDPYHSLPAGLLIWRSGCGPAARHREGRSLCSTRITTPRSIRSWHRAAKQRNCRGVVKDKPRVKGASEFRRRTSKPSNLTLCPFSPPLKLKGRVMKSREGLLQTN